MNKNNNTDNMIDLKGVFFSARAMEAHPTMWFAQPDCSAALHTHCSN